MRVGHAYHLAIPTQFYKEKCRVDLTITIGRRVRKTASYIDPHTAYVHMYTLNISRQNDCNKW